MRISVISDTHGVLDDDIFDFIKDTDEVWHAGDIGPTVYDTIAAVKPVVAIWGNIDGHDMRSFLKEYECIEREGQRIMIKHIVGYPGHYDKEAKALIERLKPNIIIAGHSHILRVMPDKKNNLLYVNPGAAGNTGFHIVKTALRFNLTKEGPKNLDILEKKWHWKILKKH